MPKTDKIDAIFDRAWNGLLGLVWGDILGSFFEFKPPSIINPNHMDIVALKPRLNVFGHQFGHHTDDTALTLAAMDAFAAYGEDNGALYDRHMRCALGYFRDGAYTAHGYCADIGGTTAHALRTYAQGCPDVHRDIANSGNGFIMRLLPFSLVSLLHIPEAEKQAFYAAQSAMTHGSAICREVAWKLGEYLEALLAGEPSQARPEFSDTTDVACSPKGYVVGTANIALDSFEQATSLNQAIISAIRHGYDTDTNAAVCGMLVGVAMGAGDVEQDVIRFLPEIKRLFEAYCKGIRPDPVGSEGRL